MATINLDADLSQSGDPSKSITRIKGALGGLKKILGEIKTGIWEAFSTDAAAETSTALEQMIDLFRESAAAGDRLTKTFRTTTTAAKKVLAGFDELNVLRGTLESGSTTVTYRVDTGSLRDSSELLRAYAEKAMEIIRGSEEATRSKAGGIGEIWENLLTWIRSVCARIGSAVKDLPSLFFRPLSNYFSQDFAAGIAGTYYEVIEPLLGVSLPGVLWKLLRVFSDVCVLSEESTGEMGTAFQDAQSLWGWILSNMSASWDTHSGSILGKVLEFAMGVGGAFWGIQNETVAPSCAQMGQSADDLWLSHLLPLNQNMTGSWAPGICSAISQVGLGFAEGFSGGETSLLSFRQKLDGVRQFFSGTFAGDWLGTCGTISGAWDRVWGGAQDVCKSNMNKVILILNGLTMKVVCGLNDMIRKINRISIHLPNWSFLGADAGKRWSPDIPQLALPSQIPYLAQGAVLPANKPFMAVLGDQKHGTNIEAPLSTIQEAVALVMGDQAEAMMAGFHATVEVQREILQAVLGIRIGDEVIGKAARRYETMMTRARGGAW